ncbi:hypothetical protein RJ640_026620 [Escallonia rubra]|uniref:Protein kinase domain-containing protein n=1 Tax=Escallonia rubra TaxID=112253 RepID=A0AA88ULF1_9ASTE|nr:hypothetical protein RJ640_026620 [Escallonia rubra]
MPTLMLLLLLPLLTLVSTSSVSLMSMSESLSPLRQPHTWRIKPSLEPSAVPAPSPTSQGPVTGLGTWRRHHHHGRVVRTHAVSPSPSTVPGCGQICSEPLTSTPIGSPCGCVFPMKVRLLLDVSLYAIFPVVNELEIEVAAGTYLKQSQVIIMGATADSQSQEKTAVDINLVPLGEKFDNTTAMLTYERFWEKKVPLNKTLFGNYEVAYITYPGLPSSPPFGSFSGSGPSGSAGNQQFPITADFVHKSQKMNSRTIFIISLSAIVVFVVCVGAVSILLKYRRVGRPSNAVGPVFTPSMNKRSGQSFVLSLGGWFPSLCSGRAFGAGGWVTAEEVGDARFARANMIISAFVWKSYNNGIGLCIPTLTGLDLLCPAKSRIHEHLLQYGGIPQALWTYLGSKLDISVSSFRHHRIGSMLSSPASSTSLSLISAMPASILSVKTFALAELDEATEKFSSKRVLGEGGFGRVYHGIMGDGTEIAVKLLTRDSQNGDREFIAEVEMLSRLHHRNLVKLIGICIEGPTRCLVYEVVPNGSVESHLHGADKRKGPLDWDARLKIALGAARGLAYLHEDSNPRVIHRDFKASNVLLEDDFTPKVSDFGLAREATEGSHHISTRVMGTFGYVAPEYAMTGHLLVKSDVYSYGVVLLELLSGRKPVDMSQPPGQENLVTWARPLLTSREGLEQLVDPSLAGTYDFDDMAKVAAIASMCVHTEVTHRPFMGEVVQALKLIYNDMDEACGDYCSHRESSAVESDFKGDLVPSDSSWWNAGGITPRLIYGHASSFITMEYSSGPLEELENRPFSASSFVGGGISLPIRHGNRSGPLRTVRSKPAFYRLKGSMSEHGLLSKRVWGDNTGHEASF